MLTNEQLHDVVDYLEGTCNSLDDYLEEHHRVLSYELDYSDLLYIDERIMCCESCGWWVDTYELDDDGNCEDCQE